MKKYLLFAAAIALSGCAPWGQTVDDRQTSWLENKFPTGMEEPVFKAKVPSARLTSEQGTPGNTARSSFDRASSFAEVSMPA